MTSYEEFTLTQTTPQLAGLRATASDQDKPCVLLLHGWLDNAASFLPLAPYLQDYNWVALDFPGHGLSEHRPSHCHQHFTDWVADALTAIDALEWPSLHVIGHSMGAAVGTLLAATHPERVLSYIALEGLAPLTAPASEAPNRLGTYLRTSQRTPKRGPRIYDSIEAALDARLRTGRYDDEAAIRQVIERNLIGADGGGYVWRFDDRLRWPSPIRFTQDQVQAFLDRLSMPVTVVRADDGILPELETIKRALRRPPWRQVEEIAGGHHVHLDRPAEVGQLISRHFQAIQPPHSP